MRVTDMRNIPEGAWILRGDRGLTFARDLPPANRIVAGQWWPQDYRGPPLVSIDVDAATALNLKVGDTLTVAILGRPIEARIASMREIDWRSLGFNFAIIFAPGALEAAPYTLMATVSPADGRSTTAFERRLTTELPMVSAIRVSDIVVQVKTLLESIDGAVRIATGFRHPDGDDRAGRIGSRHPPPAIPRHRPPPPGRSNTRRGCAEPADRIRAAVLRGRAGRFRRGRHRGPADRGANIRIPVQPRLAEPCADPAGGHFPCGSGGFCGGNSST